MTTLKLVTEITAQPLVLGLSVKAGTLTLHDLPVSTQKRALSPQERRKILAILRDFGATGAAEEVHKVPFTSPSLMVIVGLGEFHQHFDHELLRRCAGAAARALDGNKGATFALPHNSVLELAAIAEGAALGSYGFHEFRTSSKSDHPLPLAAITLLSPFANDAKAKKAIRRAEILASYSKLVRDLVNTPPSHLTPASFSLQLKKAASALGLKVEILNETALKSKGYGGITAVGQGSVNPPRLLKVSYAPPRAKKRLAFVGKGITFDSGGLALKTAHGMEAMKCDMSGAAAVICAVLAIAELKLPIAVDGWAALAENMVSSTATRPSDIITIYGGKTVEVINPDAEGRLVLADALVRAQEVGKAAGGLDGLVDVATLTGTQGVALGTRVSAVMTNNQEFVTEFLVATSISGESFWPMPLPEELRPSLDSSVADIANMGERMGGMLVAGLFLRDFVAKDLPWLHLDIASPAFNEGKPFGYTPVGGTGVALRSLVALAELAVSQA
jgi:leucyl aminopeptidase